MMSWTSNQPSWNRCDIFFSDANELVTQQVHNAAAHKQVPSFGDCWVVVACHLMAAVNRLMHWQEHMSASECGSGGMQAGSMVADLACEPWSGFSCDHAACHIEPPLSQWFLQENETLLAVMGKLHQQIKELEAGNTQLLAQPDGLPALKSSAHQPAALHNLQQALDNVQRELAAERQLRLPAEHELQVK